MMTTLSAAASLLQPTPSASYVANLREKAKSLEGVFLNTLTSAMFSSIKTDGDFGGGVGEATWRGMQGEEMADEISKSGGIGLADSITASLLAAQEAVKFPPNSTTQGAYPQ
jgi:flagellar protein FlgJ